MCVCVCVCVYVCVFYRCTLPQLRNTITITLFFITHLELILRFGAVKTTDSNSSSGSVSILPALNLFKNVSQSQMSDVVRKCTCSQHVTSTVNVVTISSTTFGTKGRRKCYKSPHPPTHGIRRRYKSWSSTSIKASRLPFPKEKNGLFRQSTTQMKNLNFRVSQTQS